MQNRQGNLYLGFSVRERIYWGIFYAQLQTPKDGSHLLQGDYSLWKITLLCALLNYTYYAGVQILLGRKCLFLVFKNYHSGSVI